MWKGDRRRRRGRQRGCLVIKCIMSYKPEESGKDHHNPRQRGPEGKSRGKAIEVQSRRSLLTFESIEKVFTKAFGVKSPWLTMLKQATKYTAALVNFVFGKTVQKDFRETTF